jgi:putative DNA primase/helicase
MRKQYLEIIWAIAATGWTCAEQLAREWCGKSPPDFVEADFVRDWNSFNPNKPDGIHIGTLHHIANQYPSADDWPDPKPIEAPFPKVMPLDTSWLPVAFQAFVDDHSELMQVPPDMIAAPLMVAAAACLGNILAIAPKAFDTSWLVVPVLWGGCVGRPGLMKSPAISIATKPLDPIEQAIASGFAAKQQQYKIDKLQYDGLLKAAKTAAARPPTNSSPISLPPEPEEPQPERLVVNDSTAQKLGDILRHSPRGVLVQRDEIVSLLESLAAEGQEGARGFYLEAWNGLSSHRVDRIGRGSLIIPRLAVWIFGGIQPGKLQPYVRQATSGGGGDDGLLQRFQILVWPDASKEWTKVDRPPNLAAHAAVDAVFARLRNIDPVAIGATQGNVGSAPAYLHFTTEAQAVFDQWWAHLEHSIRNGDKHSALESHQAKYKSLIPALALVIHVADFGTGPVPLAALEKSIRCGTYLWSHAKRVYASATNSAQASAAALAARIRSGKVANGFSARNIQRHGWQYLTTPSEVAEAIEWLIDSGWLRRTTHPAGKSGGRPADTYTINPMVLTVLSSTPPVL